MKTCHHLVQIAAWLALPLISFALPKYTVHDLGTLGGLTSVASGINNSGQVAGTSEIASGRSRAFRTAPNSAINPATDDLGTLGGLDNNFAHGINDSGQAAGLSSFRGRAFRTAPNSAINPATDDLGTLGGSFSAATGINNSGQVVGHSITATGQDHAFRTAANRAINPATDDLGTLGGLDSSAEGINNTGQVVGFITTTSLFRHAFLFSGGVMYDLNDLIPANSGWVIQEARSINDLGQIVGFGFVNGTTRAFRLDPVSLCTPPTISGASATPSVLWPPNHKFVSVNIEYATRPSCGDVCTLSVSSNEGVGGSGNTSPDWVVLDAHTVLLRAERAGGGNGRVYTIAISCTNSAGANRKTVEVVVPHDQRK